MAVPPSPSSPVRQRRRSGRVNLMIPVTVSGECETGPFTENTQTLIISAHGALIVLAATPSKESRLLLKSVTRPEPSACRVVRVAPAVDGKSEVTIEFVEPAPNFWRVTFPPEDWLP